MNIGLGNETKSLTLPRGDEEKDDYSGDFSLLRV